MSPEYDALRQIRSKHVPPVKTDIGSALKAAREKKGLALDAVARQTRISKRYLEALESDRFEEFPALVYLRGFLKSYCEFLETPFEPLWSQVEAATAPSAAPAGAAPVPAPAPEPAVPAPAAPAHEPARASKKDKGARHAPTSHPEPAHHGAAAGRGLGGGAAGAIAFSLVLAGGLAYWLLSSRGPATPALAPEPPKALQPLPPSVEPTVVIRLKDDAWLRVTLDGQVVFEGRAPRGSAQEWKPARSLGVRSTSPEALAVELNGAPRELGPAGADGEHRIDIQ